MSYGHDVQPAATPTLWTFHGWKRAKLHHTSSSAPELPLPVFPPALRFDVSGFASSYDTADDFEKALIYQPSSYRSFDSDTATLVESSSWVNVNPSKITYVAPPLPPKRHSRLLRHLRLTIFTVYRRIFSLIFIINSIGLILLLQRHSIWDIDLDSVAIWASSNFLVSILIRQDQCINLIFRTAWLLPWSLPLRVRRAAVRVYTYGGIHSGTAVAGTLWFLAFTVITTTRFIRQHTYTFPIFIITWTIISLLALILILAFPSLRSRYHNTFELSHRLLGWASIILFWIQLLLLAHHTALTNSKLIQVLIRNPTFWNLTLISLMLIHPWIRLRRWTFTATKLSTHALLLQFKEPVHKFSCLSISTSPLKEWHPFATFPSTDPERASHANLVVSAAGDWTQALIERANKSEQEMKFWVKGCPKAGVLSLSCMFHRVVILTTGSGIGPSLSSLLDRPLAQRARLVWSTRSPMQTFGIHLTGLVEKVDPGAIVIDTDEVGRPDLVRVAWKAYQEMDAEAVFVLSNESVTRKVVYGLEARGVPAFGPIWDS